MGLTIKARLVGILGVVTILIIGAISSQTVTRNKNTQQVNQAQTRYLSYLIADEFMQSSLDLTRLCRTFIATGDNKYFDAYLNIVKWRNGEVARPSSVHASLYPGVVKKQSDIMRELNFSAQEFALIKQASDNSNALIETETQAMVSAQNGQFAQGPHQPLPNESVTDFALRIVFDSKYHYEITNIMKPVSQFFDVLNTRTQGQVTDSQQSARFWLNISLSSQIVILFLVLCISVYMIRVLFKPLDKAINALDDIAQGEGDLTKRLSTTSNDEISSLGRGFNLFASNVQQVIVELRGAINQISISSKQVNSTAMITDDAILELRNGLQQLLVAVEQLAPAIQEVATNASLAVEHANVSYSETNNGSKVIEIAVLDIDRLDSDIDNASGVINELANETNSIGKVLDVIRGIADQTNLLALNAAIEAARAGEQGRGFAVVADEVRTLAKRTQDSTSEIQSMIEGLQQRAEQAVDAMSSSKTRTKDCVDNTKKLGESFHQINHAVSAIVDVNNIIAAATEEQNAAINEIRVNVSEINVQVEKTAQGSRETAQKSELMTDLAIQIEGVVSQFKV